MTFAKNNNRKYDASSFNRADTINLIFPCLLGDVFLSSKLYRALETAHYFYENV